MGQSHLEEQIRLYLVYTLDRPLWQRLVARCEQHALHDRTAMAPMFSPWGYLHGDLVDNIGEAFGWTDGSSESVGNTTFAQRIRMIVSTFEALSPGQLQKLENSLGLEEDVAPPKSGGCYIARAVYGSYDSPEVRVLRRWRDLWLKKSAMGRGFIWFYYATSPRLVNAVGMRSWFRTPSLLVLNRLVQRLKRAGYSEVPYTEV
jgi:hypothetical protein